VTVKELIELLSGLDGNLPVAIEDWQEDYSFPSLSVKIKETTFECCDEDGINIHKIHGVVICTKINKDEWWEVVEVSTERTK